MTSMTDAVSGSHLTTLGIAEAANVPLSGANSDMFAGQTVDATSVLIKYTYVGDANLTGKMEMASGTRGTDKWRLNNGFANTLTGFANGDVDYDGTVDANDYFWLNSNYAYFLSNSSDDILTRCAPMTICAQRAKSKNKILFRDFSSKTRRAARQ